MKALKLAMLPAALAMSLLTGCGSYTRAYRASQERGQAKTAESPDGQGSVVQAGTPVESSADRVRDSKRDAEAEKKADAEKARNDEVAERDKAEREEQRARERAERAREEAERRPEMTETREMRLWRLNQEQIDDLLHGDDSDSHMLGMFLMSQDVNLSFAKIAFQRTENADVRRFARRMITDHTQMIATLKTLIEDHDIVPQDNMLARDLRDRASLGRDSLLAQDGRAFDIGYIAAELDSHRQLLAVIDDVLLPRAGEGTLREMVATMRPVISAHLAHAEQLQAALGKR